MSSFRCKREADTDKPTRYYSKRQETTVAKSIGGKVNKNSGATMFQPGDVSTDNILIECKTKMTHSDQMTIKKSWLEKIVDESLLAGKDHTALFFNFGPDEKNYVIISEDYFKELLEESSNV